MKPGTPMSQESNTPGPSGPPQFRPVPGKPGVDLGENKHPAGWFPLLPKHFLLQMLLTALEIYLFVFLFLGLKRIKSQTSVTTLFVTSQRACFEHAISENWSKQNLENMDFLLLGS